MTGTYKCIFHSFLVYIKQPFGSWTTKPKKSESLGAKGIRFFCSCHSYFYCLCRILYIVDKSTFSASEEARQLHKKERFYAIKVDSKKSHWCLSEIQLLLFYPNKRLKKPFFSFSSILSTLLSSFLIKSTARLNLSFKSLLTCSCFSISPINSA